MTYTGCNIENVRLSYYFAIMITNLNIRYMVIAFNATFNNIPVVNNRYNNHIHVELCVKQFVLGTICIIC